MSHTWSSELPALMPFYIWGDNLYVASLSDVAESWNAFLNDLFFLNLNIFTTLKIGHLIWDFPIFWPCHIKLLYELLKMFPLNLAWVYHT